MPQRVSPTYSLFAVEELAPAAISVGGALLLAFYDARYLIVVAPIAVIACARPASAIVNARLFTDNKSVIEVDRYGRSKTYPLGGVSRIATTQSALVRGKPTAYLILDSEGYYLGGLAGVWTEEQVRQLCDAAQVSFVSNVVVDTSRTPQTRTVGQSALAVLGVCLLGASLLILISPRISFAPRVLGLSIAIVGAVAALVAARRLNHAMIWTGGR